MPSSTSWCSSYRKGSLRVTLDYGRQLYLLTLHITYACRYHICMHISYMHRHMTYASKHMHAHITYACTYTWMHTWHMHVNIHVCIYHICKHTYIHTYMHTTYMHAHILTCTHIQMHTYTYTQQVIFFL